MDRRTIVSLCAAIPLAAGMALAESGGEHGPMHGRWHRPGAGFEQRLDELGLEPKQKEKVQAILDASKKKREESFANLRKAHQELRALLDKDSPDQTAIDRQVEKIGTMRTEEQKAMLHTMLGVRAELTPAQREKLKAMRREEGARHRRGTGPEGGPDVDE